MMKRMKRQMSKPPNPLFEEWLVAWQKEAKDNGSELQHSLNKAIKSLRKYPFPLLTGKECIILENFGKKICDMLDKKLFEYKKMFTEEEWQDRINGSWQKTIPEPTLPTPERRKKKNPPAARAAVSVDVGNDDPSGSAQLSLVGNGDSGVSSNVSANSTQSRGREYVPKYRSGGYAILLALYKSPQDSMDKAQLQREAQDLSDTPFHKPVPGTFYTAWSSLATLTKHDLVMKTAKPIRFQLTDRGRTLAERLSQAVPMETASSSPTKEKRKDPTDVRTASSPTKEKRKNPIDIMTTDSGISCSQSQGSSQAHSVPSVAETFFLQPGRFDVVLLVDIHETEMRGKARVDSTVSGLRKLGVLCETRHLAVGDFVWIGQDRTTSAEVVLPYVVERKRMDDFAGSVKDGRFHEQKFRLKQSGLERVIYLVEHHGSETQRFGLPFSTLMQAASNTQLVDGFLVHFAQNHDDSLLYLSCLSRMIINLFKNKTLMSCAKADLPELNIAADLLSLITFAEFNASSTKIKHWTVKEMLIKQLVQLKGLSVEKASAIAARYPTPRALISALENGAERAVSELNVGPLRKLGPATAKVLHQLYTLVDLP